MAASGACLHMFGTLQRLANVCKLRQAAPLELHISLGAGGNCRSQGMASWRQVSVVVRQGLFASGLSGCERLFAARKPCRVSGGARDRCDEALAYSPPLPSTRNFNAWVAAGQSRQERLDEPHLSMAHDQQQHCAGSSAAASAHSTTTDWGLPGALMAMLICHLPPMAVLEEDFLALHLMREQKLSCTLAVWCRCCFAVPDTGWHPTECGCYSSLNCIEEQTRDGAWQGLLTGAILVVNHGLTQS